MGTESRSPRRQRRGRLRGSKPTKTVLDELEGRFAEFRSEHPPRTRVPADLRASVVAALNRGVTRGDLLRRCGVSWNQLETWKSQSNPVRRKASKRDRSGDEVRIFSVVDEPSVMPPAAPVTAEQTLELRLGRWSVRVQLADPTEGE